MRNIEQYRNRFFNLMESTIGDVKPLLTESLTEDQKKEYKSKWVISNYFYKTQPAPKYLTSMGMYKTAIDKNEVINESEESDVISTYQRYVNEPGGNRIDFLVSKYNESFPSNSQSSELSNSPIEPDKLAKPNDGSYSLDLNINNGTVTQSSQSGSSNILSQYKKLTEENKTKYEFCKKATEGEICLVEVSMSDKNAQGKLTITKTKIKSFGYEERESYEGRINQDGQENYIRGSILKKV